MKPILVALPLLFAAVTTTATAAAAAGCKYSIISYTTVDKMIVVECDGKLVAAANVVGSDEYRIKWFDDMEKARSGDYTEIDLRDEAGYERLRKLLRIKSVPPVRSVYVGPLVGEKLFPYVVAFAAAFSICMCYVAYKL